MNNKKELETQIESKKEAFYLLFFRLVFGF